MIKFLFLFLLLFSQAQAIETIRVVVLDSGLDLYDSRYIGHLCKEGHKDVTNTDMDDSVGHGTSVAGLIEEYAKDSNYCLIIVKYYNSTASDIENTVNFRKAIVYAASLNPTIVNVSSGGPSFNEEEYNAIAQHLNITFISAAGNYNEELKGLTCFYPACYDSVNNIVVGNIGTNGLKTSSSNFGKRVTVWEMGENVKVNLPKETCGRSCKNYTGYGSGSSFSAAIYTGKLIYKRSH